MIAGSANMTLSGLGIESGSGLNPNTEFVLEGNLVGETRQQVLDILDFLADSENSIRLNSDEGRTFVESYQKTRIGGNGQPSGTTLEQDQDDEDDFNQELMGEEPELEEPEVEEPEEVEQGLYPLPRDLNELSQQQLVRYVHHYTGLTLGGGNTIPAMMFNYRRTGNRSGHYHRQIALTAHYVVSTKPFHILNHYHNTDYGTNQQVRAHFRAWVENNEIQNQEIFILGQGQNQNQTIAEIRGQFHEALVIS